MNCISLNPLSLLRCSASHQQNSTSTSTRRTRLTVCEKRLQLFCFSQTPLRFRLKKAFGKIMSLSKKQTSSHATEDPFLRSDGSHWLTAAFFLTLLLLLSETSRNTPGSYFTAKKYKWLRGQEKPKIQKKKTYWRPLEYKIIFHLNTAGTRKKREEMKEREVWKGRKKKHITAPLQIIFSNSRLLHNLMSLEIGKITFFLLFLLLVRVSPISGDCSLHFWIVQHAATEPCSDARSDKRAGRLVDGWGLLWSGPTSALIRRSFTGAVEFRCNSIVRVRVQILIK